MKQGDATDKPAALKTTNEVDIEILEAICDRLQDVAEVRAMRKLISELNQKSRLVRGIQSLIAILIKQHGTRRHDNKGYTLRIPQELMMAHLDGYIDQWDEGENYVLYYIDAQELQDSEQKSS